MTPTSALLTFALVQLDERLRQRHTIAAPAKAATAGVFTLPPAIVPQWAMDRIASKPNAIVDFISSNGISRWHLYAAVFAILARRDDTALAVLDAIVQACRELTGRSDLQLKDIVPEKAPEERTS